VFARGEVTNPSSPYASSHSAAQGSQCRCCLWSATCVTASSLGSHGRIEVRTAEARPDTVESKSCTVESRLEPLTSFVARVLLLKAKLQPHSCSAVSRHLVRSCGPPWLVVEASELVVSQLKLEFQHLIHRQLERLLAPATVCALAPAFGVPVETEGMRNRVGVSSAARGGRCRVSSAVAIRCWWTKRR
jgi:hypothetical protein